MVQSQAGKDVGMAAVAVGERLVWWPVPTWLLDGSLKRCILYPIYNFKEPFKSDAQYCSQYFSRAPQRSCHAWQTCHVSFASS